MESSEIADIHAKFWRPGWGSVTVGEVEFFQELIREHRPASFVEIGTASGLSGGLICLLLEENGGRRFTTVDHDNTFFGDQTKENGFQLPLIYPGGSVEVARLTFTTAIDLLPLGLKYDMAFVDANHQHPWPLLDTLCLFPIMTSSKIVLHHDLDLYRRQTGKIFGIGPKYLYDQFPGSHRRRAKTNHGNLCYLSLDMSLARFERIAMDAFSLPWSLRNPIETSRIDAFKAVLGEHYSPAVRERFEECVAKFNRPL